MNSERLLEAFSKIGDDTDRIQLLRKIAIALAVSGKLDKGAATLSPRQVLDAVDRVKADLAKRGIIPKPKKHVEVILEQLPEAFSDVTSFAPLGELAKIEKGQTGIQKAQPGAFPLVVTAAERATCDHFDFEGTAAIIPLVSSTGHGNASINRLHYQEGKFALGTILVAVFPHDPNLISARFLFEYLSAFKEELLVARMTGTANVTLSVGRVADVPIPLICPEVQRKVDELMALCDQLEQARAGREAVRDRLTTASLARLTAPESDAKTFQSHARFALQTLPTLTTGPDQIKTLRQTILNLAVRGKLVEQDGADEPAGEVLKRIEQSPKNAMRGKRSSSDEAAVEPPHILPEGWVWTTFGALPIEARVGLDRGKAQQGPDLEFGYFKMNNIANDGGMDLSGLARIDASEDEVKSFRLENGDFLFNTRNSRELVGKTCVFRLIGSDVFLFNNNVLRAKLHPDVCPSFVDIWFRSQIGRELIEGLKSNTTNVCAIYQGKLLSYPCPLPPLAEQHRIVEKVDVLIALCDQLEASLTATATTRSKLLNALLHEALEPVADELVAAE